MEVVDEEDPAVDPEHVDGDEEGSELMLGMERVSGNRWKWEEPRVFHPRCQSWAPGRLLDFEDNFSNIPISSNFFPDKVVLFRAENGPRIFWLEPWMKGIATMAQHCVVLRYFPCIWVDPIWGFKNLEPSKSKNPSKSLEFMLWTTSKWMLCHLVLILFFFEIPFNEASFWSCGPRVSRVFSPEPWEFLPRRFLRNRSNTPGVQVERCGVLTLDNFWRALIWSQRYGGFEWNSTWWFLRSFVFSPLLGERIQFDEHIF